MQLFLQIDKADNALIALVDLVPGEVEFDGKTIMIQQPVPAKHKFLTEEIQAGSKVIMYGVPVGTVNTDLEAGALLTTKNLTHFADKVHLGTPAFKWSGLDVSSWEKMTFNGYHRPDGKVGTANYWLFVPLVFCENRNLRVIQETLEEALGYKKDNPYLKFTNELLAQTTNAVAKDRRQVFENIDGIRFLYHDGGCGGTRQDAEVLLRLLAGYVNHANVAGATVLSLGCQHAQIDWLKSIQKELYPNAQKPVIYLDQQQLGTEEVLIKSAIEQTMAAMKQANQVSRQPAPLSKLVVGLECGGSDGFSGISANPAVGYASDLLVSLGGATILSEFPELNGVEQNIVDRCVDLTSANKFLTIQRAYEEQANKAGSGFAMNPSPGNIKDGLITDAMKSAGAAKKGGTSPVVDVLDYTEPLTKTGLNLLCTPGNDVESTTGLAGSGANLILFTTGLGTPTGNPICPVIKIASNTKLKSRMGDIIDFDAGSIIDGGESISEVGEELLDYMIKVASGEKTKAMQLEQNDFILWKRGVSL